MTREKFHKEYKEKLKKYLAKLTSQQIQERINREIFPFFGFHEEDCLDLAWELIAERKLK